MADEKLSGKVGLDPSEFRNGIAAMNRELRVLESGFRASAASLGDWSEDASGLELRIKSLNSQMEVQQQKVSATRAEYERIRAEKGENSRAAQDLEIKLNKETETLGKMQAELNEDTAALEEMKTGTDETSDSVDELADSTQQSGGSLIDLADIMTGLNAALDIAGKAFDLLKQAITGVYDATVGLVLQSAEAAAQLVDLSTKTGISTTRLQELSFIGDQVGTSLDTITGAQARLVRSMATATDQQEKFDEALASGKDEDEIPIGDLAVAFNKLGVSVKDSSGNLRDQQDVFNELIDALGKVQNPAERDALSMQIFGKSAQELNPLIKAGSAELANLAQQAHDVGAVMDEDAVAGLEAFDDTLASVKAGIKGTLGSLAADLVPVFQEVGTALQDLFQSDTFKQGVQIASELIKSFSEDVVGIIQKLLAGDIKGALTDMFGVENAGAILNLINIIRGFIQDTLLPFFQTHGGEINSTLEGIVGAVVSLATFVTNLSIAWVSTWLQIHDIMVSVWEGFLKPLFDRMFGSLSIQLPAALQTLSGFWTGTLLPAIQAVWGFLNDSLFPLFAAIADFMGAVFGVVLRALAGIWQNVLLPPLQRIFGVLQDNLLPIFKEVVSFIQTKVQPVFEEFGAFVDENLVPAFEGISTAIASIIEWLTTMASQLNNMQLPSWMTPGSPTPWEIGLVGINKALAELNNQIPSLTSNLNNSLGNFALPGTSGGSVQNDEFNFFAPVIVQGGTPGSLAGRLKGRRF